MAAIVVVGDCVAARAGQRRHPPGLGRLGDALEQGQRLVVVAVAAPVGQQLGQADDGVVVVGLAARGPCAATPRRRRRPARRRSAPRSLGSSRSTNCGTAASGWAPMKPSTTLPPDSGVHGGDALHPEGLGDLRVLVDVDLGQHDLAVGLVDHLLEDRAERAARPHHGAHRSTTTGVGRERSSTSVWKVASVTSMAIADQATGGPRRDRRPRRVDGEPPMSTSPTHRPRRQPDDGPHRRRRASPRVTAWFEAHVAGRRAAARPSS